MGKTKAPSKKKHLEKVPNEVIIPAAIRSMPTFNTLTAITDWEGRVVTHPDGQPATLRSIAMKSLMEPCEQPGVSKAMAAIRAYNLADRINRENNVILSEEDASLLKNHIASYKQWNNLVIGRCCDIIDGRLVQNEPYSGDGSQLD